MTTHRYCTRSQFRPSRLLTLAGSILILSAVGLPAPALAAPPTADTITVDWTATSLLTAAPPYRLSSTGTFSAIGAITDSGAAVLAGQTVADRSPVVGILQYNSITLTGHAGTLTLRCNSRSTDFSDPTAVPGVGPCAITGGTGTYADAHGQGTISTISNLVSITEVDTISLKLV